jgi:hypothetical protein
MPLSATDAMAWRFQLTYKGDRQRQLSTLGSDAASAKVYRAHALGKIRPEGR